MQTCTKLYGRLSKGKQTNRRHCLDDAKARHWQSFCFKLLIARALPADFVRMQPNFMQTIYSSTDTSLNFPVKGACKDIWGMNEHVGNVSVQLIQCNSAALDS